jgi:plasmid stability protein
VNLLVRNIPDATHKALPVIAAAYNMPSSNAVIVPAIEAMVATVCEEDPLVAAAIKFKSEKPQLPARVSS